MVIGSIKMAGRNAPLVTFGAETWLLCNGGLVPVATYPALFGVIAYAFGGAGANFRLPHYGNDGAVTGRIPVGISALGYALAAGAGADNHDHLMGFGAPGLAHVPATIGTGVPLTTVNTLGAGPGLIASAGHWHISSPLDPHAVAAAPIGASASLSPCLPVGFYIRAL